MSARILSIGTAVPPTTIEQHDIRDFFISQAGGDRLAQRLVRATFDAADIDTRHTVLPELGKAGSAALDGLFVDDRGLLRSPGTGLRNAEYMRHAPALSNDAARTAMQDAGVEASAITHVVTASCTGCYAPGPDFRIVRDLGLAPTTERYHLGFLGCAAAFPALRLADRICAAQPGSVVLVVCTELCSLHIRPSSSPDQIVASSVFADGAAAAIVTGVADGDVRGGLEIQRFATTITEDGEADMAWTIGDDGFEMVLTGEVPRIIGREIRGAVDGFLLGEPVDTWAVHPGGRSILDRVQTGLDLDPSALRTSRAVLREHGNMSSATILFILERMLRDDAIAAGATIAGLAFGPGLTVESALLTKLPAPSATPTAAPAVRDHELAGAA
ncbi:type III polyketide synthase [Microbacterium pygmaeum]|uniref:Predicted naringenin-chalcone synthase n=1 Tax=Microbacterium pygmaeum TaxID=370764 RepID=A0A1G7V7G0_9MICO|nr:type III polyketide synthase [Microbacterium pygmaeum]SDG54890.1 Predicted naringenin-chalcone synthase [Microbacterium pygmaeum]